MKVLIDTNLLVQLDDQSGVWATPTIRTTLPTMSFSYSMVARRCSRPVISASVRPASWNSRRSRKS